MPAPSADRVYDLAYLPSSKGRQPELIIRVFPPYTEKLQEHVTRSLPTHVFRETGVSFENSDEAFGYGGCAFRERPLDYVEYHFPLKHSYGANIVRTCSLVLDVATALAAKSEANNTTNRREPNRSQMLTLMMGRNPLGGLHAYPLEGWIASSFRRWLVTYAKQSETNTDSWSGMKPLPEPVRLAMKDAWKALARRDWVRWADDVRASVAEDGRFSFSCFGNACDIAIYPDRDYGVEFEYVSHFSCHNLDTAEQQLTLLVGLVVLTELVLKDID